MFVHSWLTAYILEVWQAAAKVQHSCLLWASVWCWVCSCLMTDLIHLHVPPYIVLTFYKPIWVLCYGFWDVHLCASGFWRISVGFTLRHYFMTWLVFFMTRYLSLFLSLCNPATGLVCRTGLLVLFPTQPSGPVDCTLSGLYPLVYLAHNMSKVNHSKDKTIFMKPYEFTIYNYNHYLLFNN